MKREEGFKWIEIRVDIDKGKKERIEERHIG